MPFIPDPTLASTPASTIRPTSFCSHRRASPGRHKAILEGISLWLAILLFLAIQSLYARAGESPVAATLLPTDYQLRASGLIADCTAPGPRPGVGY